MSEPMDSRLEALLSGAECADIEAADNGQPPLMITDAMFLLTADEAVNIERLERRMYAAALGHIDMTTEQVQLAKALLNKHKPDRKATELTGPGGGAIVVEIARFGEPEPVKPEASR